SQEYRAALTNATGTVNSGAATLTVETINNPASATVIAGQSATFTVSVNNGAIPAVQWQRSTDGGSTWSNVAGATATTLSFATTAIMNSDEYRAALTTSAGT